MISRADTDSTNCGKWNAYQDLCAPEADDHPFRDPSLLQPNIGFCFNRTISFLKSEEEVFNGNKNSPGLKSVQPPIDPVTPYQLSYYKNMPSMLHPLLTIFCIHKAAETDLTSSKFIAWTVASLVSGIFTCNSLPQITNGGNLPLQP